MYHFAFPETVEMISSYAFQESGLSGALVIPDDVKEICTYAFYGTNISSVSFPFGLERISGYGAFGSCSSCSGQLSLPESLVYIGNSAFNGCAFSGMLTLPENLEYIGESAFSGAGRFTGGLTIPEQITTINQWTFSNCGFTGYLNLNNVIEIQRLPGFLNTR